MQYTNLKTNTRACAGKKSPAYKTVKYFVTLAVFLFAVCWMPVTVPAQTTLPAGSDIPAFITSGNYYFTLAGNATWNSAFTINTAARAALRIEGDNNTITVAAGGISMLRDFQTDNNIYIYNANFRPTGTPGLSTLNDYLIGFERANIVSYLNLEGSSFSGFSRTANRGGTIMYAYGSNTVTINGGDKGVLFQGNRAERNAAGVLAVTSSTITFVGKVTFDGNWTGNYGGAVTVYSDAANLLNFKGETVFTNNYSRVFGGAIDVWGGQATVVFDGNTRFEGNHVTYIANGGNTYTNPEHITDQNPRGGAINIGYIASSGNGASVTFNGPAIFRNNYVIANDNTKSAMGGAISVYGNGNSYNYNLTFNNAAVFDGNYVYATGSGAGELIFYGDGSANSDYDSNIRGNTVVQGGYFTLDADVGYGNTGAGTFTVNSGGTVRGGNAAELRTTALLIQSGGALGVTGGTFNVNSNSITLQDGALLTGNGTLTAASNLNISGTVTADITAGQTLNVNPVIAGSGGLAKINGGTLALNTAATYTGAATINQGVLSLNTANAITGSSAVTVNSGATLALNNTAQSINNLSGGGTVELGTGAANTLTVVSGSSTVFSGAITGTGSLAKQGSGSLTLSGNSDYGGGTSINAGRLIIINGDAAGSGAIANNTTLELAFAADSTLANVISGDGALEKSGGGTATLTGAGSTVGSVSVSGGTLNLAQTGAFTVTGAYTTQGNAVTAINGGSSLNVGGVFTQAADSTLNIAIVPDNITTPIITADSASLSGTLDVTDLEFAQALKASELDDNRYLIIQTDAGIISGDFTTFVMGTVTNPQDYLVISGGKSADQKTYSIGLSLAWNAGAPEAHGTFTIAAGESFEVDVALNDQSPVAATGWDGVSLTKNGAGTLILSSPTGNGYTGATIINGGMLQTNVVNALLNSGSVVVNGGATLNLNNSAQIVQNLSGAGTVDLAVATLTVFSNGDTTFDGLITGSGQLHKNGASTFTLTGVNDYSGGTMINDGRLIATNAQALGTGAITNDGVLELDFTADGTLTNALSGGGVLIKSGAGAATLNSTNPTVGSVDVSGGSLVLADNVAFSATGDYTTQSNAATVVNNGATLTVGGKLTQNANASLSVAVSNTTTPVTVNSAALDGKLVISNFPSLNRNARALETVSYIVIQSTGGNTITGDFSAIDFGGVESNVDYLILKGVNNGDTYTVGFGLAWFAG